MWPLYWAVVSPPRGMTCCRWWRGGKKPLRNLRRNGAANIRRSGMPSIPARTSISFRLATGQCPNVLYPLQSLRKEIRPFPEFPLLIDACQPGDLPLVAGFARTIARQVQHGDDATRLKLHVAAIFANNFTNFLYTLAAGFCRQEGIDFQLLLPLIRETAQRVERYDPREVQTGPAIRGDRQSMERHLEILGNYRNMSDLYRQFSDQIREYYERLEG